MVEVNLPDFDDLIALTSKIGKTKTRLLVNKATLEQEHALITELVSSDATYYIGSKPPSMAYIKSNFHVLGINKKSGERIKNLRLTIAEDEGSLRENELLFDVYRDMIDVWRTESANKRGSFFEGQ